jgi:phosphonatase-like hydrolase
MSSAFCNVALVVFDLAGTTIRDSGHVASAVVAALMEQGIDVAETELAGVRGESKRQAIASFIPQGPNRASQANDAYASFCRHVTAAYRTTGVEPIDGAEAVFRELRSRSIRVAINTGFDRAIADVLLQAVRWDADAIDAIVYGDDVSHGRPAPFLIFRAMERTGVHSVHTVVSVGDTISDLHAGHNAGVRWNVGVLSGAHDRQTLSQAPHTHLIESIAELTSFP